jgi:hypothetical protein
MGLKWLPLAQLRDALCIQSNGLRAALLPSGLLFLSFPKLPKVNANPPGSNARPLLRHVSRRRRFPKPHQSRWVDSIDVFGRRQIGNTTTVTSS